MNVLFVRLGALLALLLASCASRVAPPAVRVPAEQARAAWERVLDTHVAPTGEIDFDGLREQPEDLDAFVGWVASTSPEADPADFPEQADVLAFHINAYNGLAMYNVLHAGVRPSAKVRFFYLRELQIGGEWISLYEYENEVIRPLGEERIHFALNCMVVDCPRLQREPFRADGLDAQLEAATVEFLNDPRGIQVREDGSGVELSAILDWYREDFPEPILDYVGRYHRGELPPDAKVRYQGYDWTLNGPWNP